jgi:predicted permease
MRLAGLAGKARQDRELTDEIESHLQMHIDDNLRAGMGPDEARRAARLKLGGVEAVKEAYRDRSSVPLLEHLAKDVRFSCRQLRKSPVFTSIALFVLAVGMCAAIAIFAFVDAALIKPLPYPDPARLAAVTESALPQFPRANLSYFDYVDWKRLNTVFDSLEVFTGDGFLMDTPTGAEPATAARVSAGFFRTLGVRPLLGRYFTREEEVPNGRRVVMLDYGTWKARFGGRDDIIGQTVRLSGQLYTISGVLPAGFHFAPRGAVEFWTTLDVAGSCAQRRSCHNLDGVARLKEGVSIDQARDNMAAIARRLEEQYPDSNRGQGANVMPLSEIIAGQYRPILMTLMGGAGLLLLISCVNVASLLLVRSEGRRRELAVRAALGASTARLTGQFLTESALLVAVSSALGLLSARWAMQALMKLIPAQGIATMPFLVDLGLNMHVLACAAAIALMALLLFSITPALHFSLSRMQDGLTEGSRGSAGKAWRRLGSRLVVAELAMAMILLATGALFGKSLYRLLHVELGLQPDHLAAISVQVPDVRYPKPEQMRQLGREVATAVESIPGVRSAAIAVVLPVNFNGNTDWIRFVGKPYDGKHIEVNERDVSANYFRTIGAKLAHGRYFDEAEDETKTQVVIINQTLANRYFAGEDPIGRQIGDTALSPKSIRTIVGVVEDMREGSLDSEIWPAEYHPFNQDPNTFFWVLARTSLKPEAMLPALSSAIHRAHPDAGTGGESTMQALIDNSLTAYLHRSSAWLVGVFAITALLLGVVGLYGVIAYSVSQRTREIGVRMALGAANRSVYLMILREAGRLVMFGIVLGLAGAIVSATLARKLLFGVSTWDVQTLVSMAATLALAAALASFVPARRAASVNPVEALRAE